MAGTPKTGQAQRAGIIVEDAKMQETLISEVMTLVMQRERAGALSLLAHILEKNESIRHQAETMVRLYEEGQKFNMETGTRGVPRIDAPVGKDI